MAIERPSEVTVEHLQKFAIIYLRQSTEFQVNNNTASADYQRNQVRFPMLWGWPEHLIVTEERDLGVSGTTANRTGYQEVLSLIRADKVGAFFIADFTRGGRDAREWLALMEECRDHDVLVVIDGRCHSMRVSAHVVYAKLMAVVADIENSMRCETMRRARRTRAASGKAVSKIPTGYMKGPEKGTWILDPDVSVQAAIRAVFDEYPKAGSLRRTIIALRRKGIRLSLRQQNGDRREVEPKASTLSKILHNPAYTGLYRYGVTMTDPAKRRTRPLGAQEGNVRRIPAPASDVITIPDHHPAYVNKESWDEIQRMLRANERNPDHNIIGPSDDLVQGITRCGISGGEHLNRVMKIAPGWPSRKTGQPGMSYVFCIGDYESGGSKCIYVPVEPLNLAVRDAVFARLAPAELAIAKDAFEKAKTEEPMERRRREKQLQRLQQVADDVKYRLFKVDPDNRLVAAELEREYEKALKELGTVKRQIAEEEGRPSPFKNIDIDDLLKALADPLSVFLAPTTTNQDRKMIVRFLASAVIIEEKTPYVVRARIVWVDGVPNTQIEVRLFRYAHLVIDEMTAEGEKPKEIKRVLDEMGCTTTKGRPWTLEAIASRRHVMRKARREVEGHAPRVGSDASESSESPRP